jgi:hypothetical protein
MHRKELVSQEAQKLSGSTPRSKEWIGVYSTATANVIAQLDDEEREEMNNILRKWEEEGPPRELQER